MTGHRASRVLLACLLTLGTASPASAQFAIGVNGGTLGIGPDVSVAVADRFALRAGATFTGLSAETTSIFDLDSGIESRLTMPKQSFKLDAHFLLGGGPRIGAGLLVWLRNPNVELTPGAGSIDVGGATYEGSDINQMVASIGSTPRAPFVVLGFGSPAGKGFRMLLDLGVVFLSDSSIDLTATGADSVVGSQEFQTHLAQEALSLQDELGWAMNYWPILTLGFRYGF